MSVFLDVAAFMRACGHEPDTKKVGLYLDLVREEIGELEVAMSAYHAATSAEEDLAAKADAADAICDSIWVLIGLAKVMDLPIEFCWDEVVITNAKKCDPELGTILRDASGKIMKPPGWRPPNMQRIIQQYQEQKSALGEPEANE